LPVEKEESVVDSDDGRADEPPIPRGLDVGEGTHPNILRQRPTQSATGQEIAGVWHNEAMPARSIGTGTLSFGMVSIPIRMYSAGESASAVSFNLLHGKCNSRLKQQYVCPKDNEIVPRDQMVKGYEFSKEQYVTFTDDELKSMAQEAQKAIEITEFVPAATVDPVYFDRPYYLVPDKGGEKAYRLLNEAMKKTGRSALAKWAARGKQYLVLIRPAEKGLVMQQLLYADEVRPLSEVPIGDADLKEPELQLAVQLIEQIASDEFHPEHYEDDVRKRYQAAIQQKIDGQEITSAPEAPKAQIIDLMEALKASLASKGEAQARASAARDSADQATGTEG
jgi:DNA end-binding protein Ku